jgi:hypothetical protein
MAPFAVWASDDHGSLPAATEFDLLHLDHRIEVVGIHGAHLRRYEKVVGVVG